MNTSGLLQSKSRPRGFTLLLQETESIHDSMNLPKNEFIAYIYILLLISKILIYLNLGNKTVLYLICNCINSFVGG